MLKYNNLNDYELVYQVRENNDVAYETLVSKYSHLVDIMANKIYKKNKNISIEYDDLYQEGMYGIMRALNDYDQSNTLFYTYACLCAKREMERLIKTHKRKKHSILNEALSIYDNISGSQDLFLGDTIPSEYNLESEYEVDENCKNLLDLKYDLDFIDSQVFELRLNNFSIREIDILLDITYKNVDYRLHKIRKKIMNFVYNQ